MATQARQQKVTADLALMEQASEQQGQAYALFLFHAQRFEWDKAEFWRLRVSASVEGAMDAFMRACRELEEGERGA